MHLDNPPLTGHDNPKTKHLLNPKWHGGQVMAFSGLDGPTDFRSGLVARTAVSPAGIDIMDPDRFQIRFTDAPASEVLFGGDFFSFAGLAQTTRGVFLDAHHLLIEGPCEFSGSGQKLTSLQRGKRLLVGSEGHFQPALIEADIDEAINARSEWILSLDDIIGMDAPAALWRACTLMKSQVCSAEGTMTSLWTTPERWPHKVLWIWDSVFHALAWRYLDQGVARHAINAIFDNQDASGFIPLKASPYSFEKDMTQAPVIAYGVKLIAETIDDWDWARSLYPKLCAYVQWDLDNRDTDGGGLAEWFIEEHLDCRCGESGMDNSPRFDSAIHLDAVDFNAFLALECEVLAEFATRFGYEEDAKKWSALHQKLCGLINKYLWSPEKNFYCDYDPAKGERTPVLSSAGFLPLICGAATPDQAQWLARHLEDPQMFKTAFPIASIAVCDEAAYSKDMWRGPTWINMNWLIAAGFERYGMHDVARSIRSSTAAEIERCFEKFGTFFEYYDDRREVEPPRLLRKGECAPERTPYAQVVHEFGWSATLYVDLLLGDYDLLVASRSN